MRLHELLNLDVVLQVGIPCRLLAWRVEHSLEEGHQRGSVVPCHVPGGCPTYQLYASHAISCLIVWLGELCLWKGRKVLDMLSNDSMLLWK